MKKTQINFTVELDENQVPEKISWEASDSKKVSECKSTLISIWDKNEENTLRIDLWTKDMMVDEMKMFFHQTMLTMADTYERATGEQQMSSDIREFCHYFAEKQGILGPQG